MKLSLSLLLLSAAIGNAAAAVPTLDGEGFELAMRFSDESEFVFCSSYWTDTELMDAGDSPDPALNADGKFHPFVNTVAAKIKGCLTNASGAMECKTYDLPTPMTLQQLFKYTPIGSTDNIHFTGPSTNKADASYSDAREWVTMSGATGVTTGWWATGINFFDDKSVCPTNVRFGAMFNNERKIDTTNDAIGFGATECGNHQYGGGTKVGAGAVVFKNKQFPRRGLIYVLPAEDQTMPTDLGDPASDLMICPGPGFSAACKATAWGDPHIVTFDGLKFDAQPAGEAIFLKSTDGSLLSIQGRIEKARPGSMPAVTTAIVTRGETESDPVIQVAVASSGGTPISTRGGDCPVELLVDGVVQDSLEYWGTNAKVQQVGSMISIQYDETLRVDMDTRFFGRCYFTTNFYLYDCDAKKDSVIGLLGSPNGSPSDDWMTQDGTVLDLPAGASKYFFEPAFKYTKENWIITDENDSLFNYQGDDGFETFSDPDEKFDPEYQKQIENVDEDIAEICGDDLGCRIDGDSGGADAAEEYMEEPASQRTLGARVDEDGFELAMRFGEDSQFTFCSAYWTDSILLDEDDHSATKDADGKFAPFVNTIATEIKGCLPGGCKVYQLPTPMTLLELFTNTPIGSTDNVQFSTIAESDEALEWQHITGQSVKLETGWYASGINYFDDASGCPSKVRFGGLFNNERSISTTNDAVGFGATECGNTDVGAGATLWRRQRFPSTGTIWVKPAADQTPRDIPAQPPAAAPSTVCGDDYTSAPTIAPSKPATDAPTESPSSSPVIDSRVDDDDDLDDRGPGSGSGDPHFKTWSGDKYDYHGECDLVLLDQPNFSNGKGLKVHIRTERVKYFSFISNIAVMIGDDVLEFNNDVNNFKINGKKVEKQRKWVTTYLSGFHVRRDPKAISLRFDEVHKAKIDLIQRQNGFPAVVVDGGTSDIFKGSLGLLGDWATGKRFARDGVTEMNDPDATAFALEWQVRDTEPMLFSEARFPQYPTTCTPPAKQLTNRLGMSKFKKEAEEACAHWKEDKEDCIFDVIATRDISVATEGSIGASVA